MKQVLLGTYNTIKSIEIIVFKDDILLDGFFPDSAWKNLYIDNGLYNSDHILKFALRNFNNFFIWEHLSYTPTEKIVYEKRCKNFNVNNGFTISYKLDDIKLVCMFGMKNHHNSLEEFISQQREAFKELIKNVKHIYIKNGHHGLWNTLLQTYTVNQNRKAIS
jgi:hypothetical protein